MKKCFALLLIFFFAVPLRAQRRSTAAAPPPVVSQSVIVRPGETVAIALGIHGSRGESLEFIIRSQPKFGKLSEVRALGVNSAHVSYTAPLKGVEEDRFSYAVRCRDGVSAPGVVGIIIPVVPAQPAKLSVPETLFLPKVFPGQRAMADLELRNTGGTALSGEAKISAPWSIEGQTRYSIGPGESTTLKVALMAEKPGSFSTEVMLGPEQAREVTVKCVVEEAFVVSPARLSLPSVADEKSRKALFRASNRSEEELVVTVSADARLLVSKSFTVPARGSMDVSIAANNEAQSAFDAQVTLQSVGWSVDIPVHVEALRVVLEAPKKPVLSVPIAEKRTPLAGSAEGAPVLATAEASEMPAKAVEPSGPAQMQSRASEFPNMMGNFARVTSATSALIEWPASLGPAKGLHFQARELSVDGAEQLQVTWRDLKSVEIKDSPGNLRAEIRDLLPAQIHTLRLLRGEDPVFTVQFSTPPKKPFVDFGWMTVFLILLFPALAWFAWHKWKMRARSAW